jgi:hypothetical protein
MGNGAKFIRSKFANGFATHAWSGTLFLYLAINAKPAENITTRAARTIATGGAWVNIVSVTSIGLRQPIGLVPIVKLRFGEKTIAKTVEQNLMSSGTEGKPQDGT